jgi:hypothetical protein
MAAAIPPGLPPGYMSVFQAMEYVDPGFLADIGTDEDRREFEKFVSMSKGQTDRDGNVLAPPAVYDEFVRRRRRREAYNRICELCAYGTVPSALLLDDFTVRAGISSIFWLNERFSAKIRETGRSPVREPRSKYSVDGPSGWVMIDTVGFRTAIAAAVPIPPERDGASVEPHSNLPTNVSMTSREADEPPVKPPPKKGKPFPEIEIITWLKERQEKWPDARPAPDFPADWTAFQAHCGASNRRTIGRDDFARIRTDNTHRCWHLQGRHRINWGEAKLQNPQ